MDADRWVHCCHCGQTYAAGLGADCSLCGKAGGLWDVPRPPPDPDARDRGCSVPAAGSGGAALAGGCLGMLAGAALGLIIAMGLPANEVAQAEDAGEQCGTGVAMVLFGQLVGRAALGVTLGSAVGAVAGVVVSAGARAAAQPDAGSRPDR